MWHSGDKHNNKVQKNNELIEKKRKTKKKRTMQWLLGLRPTKEKKKEKRLKKYINKKFEHPMNTDNKLN